MIMRIWTTKVDETRAEAYERFAQERSLPMFKAQPGFRGALFGRAGCECAVVTLWESSAAADALEASASYRETVAEINAAGFLWGISLTARRDLHAIHVAAFKGSARPEGDT